MYMKRHLKELVILFIQLFLFYIFPLFMNLYGPIGIVLIILSSTFVLSITIAIISKENIKYLYPIVSSISFLPSVFIYYNESALIHCLWYLFISSIGILIGSIIYQIKKELKIQ
ncbi:MAG: hypothetical protein IJE04_03820 [Bacilli bacterium]|nr:hypothetical protein [Bacilli bacterium]